MFLRRKIEKTLDDYYKNPDAKILMVEGARQIGKSYIIGKTAKAHFRYYVEISFSNASFRNIFQNIQTIDRFYLNLTGFFDNRLHNASDTIVFLDEIQLCPGLIPLLKELKADARYRFICSGSLLGSAKHHRFIPMGSIDEINMHPLDFEEFLWASGCGSELIDSLRDCYQRLKPIDQSIHEFFFERWKEYLLCGGLPDAVLAYCEQKNAYLMRRIQSQTIRYYKDDAGKYDDEYSPVVRRIYDLLPSYMANKVRRVVAKDIKGTPASMSDFSKEIVYLLDSGCVNAVQACADPKFPLQQSVRSSLLKLYYNDVGILTGILYGKNLDAVLSSPSPVNLGSVYETAVAMELSAHDHQLFYFDVKKVGEVDFLVNDYDDLSVMPIEVKSGRAVYEFRAIPKLIDPRGPYKLRKGIILSNDSKVQSEGNLIHLPVYMAMFI